MIPDRWESVSRLVAEALELEPEQRCAFLDAACEGDVTLRNEIDSLVAAAESGSSFIDRPLWVEDAGDRPDFAPVQDREADTWLGRTLLGKYEIVAVVGRGGMGTVYRATDVSGGRRHVAIKLVEEPLLGRLLASRLRTERQIMSRFDHPNIARLLDWGTTGDGFPFLVVEFVTGDRIDDYCRKRELSLRDRLELFQQLCSAVKYAHRNLVVHRDIKPGNVLVTDDGVVKLLDFGIAKLLRSDEDEDTIEQTRAGEWLFTPGYASPEQLRGEPVTTASDVFALGVLLFELLTETRFAAKRLESVDKPAAPDAALSDGSGLQVSYRRAPLGAAVRTKGTEPSGRTFSAKPPKRSGRPLLRGDLGQVIKTATRLEPDRRYGTVEQLSEDARRYLEGLPLLSRGDSILYTTRKLLVRHYEAAALALLVVLSLVAGAGLFAWKAEAARSAELRTNRLLYATRMRLAYEAWNDSNVRVTRELLEQTRVTTDSNNLRGVEWTYLWNQLNVPSRSAAIQVPQDAWISDVRFSPDGRVAAMADSAGTLTLWNPTSAAQISRVSTRSRDIAALCYSPDGRHIAAASKEGRVSILKADASEIVAEHLAPLGGWPNYGSLAFSPDGRHLALCGGGDGMVSVRDLETGAELRSFSLLARGAKEAVVGSTAISSDLRYVAAAVSSDSSEAGGLRTSIAVWDLRSGRRLLTWPSGVGGIHALGFSPDGSLLAGAAIGTITVWEVKSQNVVDLYSGHMQLTDVLQFSPDGQLLLTGSLNVTRLRNVTTRSNVATIKVEAALSRLSPNGETIATVSLDEEIEFRELSKLGVRDRIPGDLIGRHGVGTIHTVDFTSSAVSKWVFMESWVAVNSFVPSAPLVRPPRLRATPDEPAFASEYLPVVATQSGSRFDFWDASGGDHLGRWDATAGTVKEIAMSSQPGVFAVVEDSRLVVSDHGNSRMLQLPSSTGSLGTPRFSPDGDTLGVLDIETGTLLLWSIGSLGPIGTISSENPIAQFAVSPDSKLVAIGYMDGAIEVRLIADNTLVSRMVGHKAWVLGLCFAADGRRLISCAIDNSLRIWEPDTGEEVGFVLLEKQSDAHGRFELLSDGTLLISNGPATDTYVWRAP